jgi:hypothetical protein
MRFRWKKIEGIGGIKQILRLWRNDFNEKIEFKDLLQRIDKEFPFDLSWRTKINYLSELVDIKLLGREKKGRQTFYWPLQAAEIVRACILELISQTPEDNIIPSGFLTFFGFNPKTLTIDEKRKLLEIRDEFQSVFQRLMTFKGELWKRKLQSAWNNIIKDREIHPVTKWVFWWMHTISWFRLAGPPQSRARVLETQEESFFSHACSSIVKICEKHGVKIPMEKNKTLAGKVSEMATKDALDTLIHAVGQIYKEEGTKPLALVGACPVRKTPLGEDVFHLKHALEKDLVETVLPQIDAAKRGSIRTKLDEKIATLSEKEREVEGLSKFQFFVKALSTEQLEHDVCDWVRSEIL